MSPTHVEGLQVEAEGRAIRKAVGKSGEELVNLLLAMGAAPCTEDADRLVAGPRGSPRGGVAIVEGQFGVG